MNLDDWSKSTADLNLLKDNLESNIRVFCPQMTQEEREQLTRLNLIMVRQYVQSLQPVKKSRKTK